MKTNKLFLLLSSTFLLAGCSCSGGSSSSSQPSTPTSHSGGGSSGGATSSSQGGGSSSSQEGTSSSSTEPVVYTVTESQFDYAFTEPFNNVTVNADYAGNPQTIVADGNKEYDVGFSSDPYYLDKDDDKIIKIVEKGGKWYRQYGVSPQYMRNQIAQSCRCSFSDLTYDDSTLSYKGTDVDIMGMVTYDTAEYWFENQLLTAAKFTFMGSEMSVNFTKYGTTVVDLPSITEVKVTEAEYNSATALSAFDNVTLAFPDSSDCYRFDGVKEEMDVAGAHQIYTVVDEKPVLYQEDGGVWTKPTLPPEYEWTSQRKELVNNILSKISYGDIEFVADNSNNIYYYTVNDASTLLGYVGCNLYFENAKLIKIDIAITKDIISTKLFVNYGTTLVTIPVI